MAQRIPPAAELPPLYTLSGAAAHLGMAVSTLCERAAVHSIGRLTEGGGFRVFTAADMDTLEKLRRPRGNPNFGKSQVQ